jgi:monofunctional biosynthetic peptidoglycan transglycosylase
VLPQPKKREAITPSGFTRRYGNSISRRIAVVARDGLDGCLSGAGTDVPEPAQPKPTQLRPKRSGAPAPPPSPERAEDYIYPAPPETQPDAEVDPVPPPEPEIVPPAETNGI